MQPYVQEVYFNVSGVCENSYAPAKEQSAISHRTRKASSVQTCSQQSVS
jgi:hypothetical protein